ncbi:MAG: DUF2029 domain-containing protein [Candidatus Dormibacteraeota bacterium]|nr:DUF2029 domain-containing protein [Candidatus Dormibacteraeota bacterium]
MRRETVALRAAAVGALLVQCAVLFASAVHTATAGDAASSSDYAASWFGASAWRSVGPSHAYDFTAQAALYSQVTHGVAGAWAHPFTWAPLSLLLALPVSLLPLPAAFSVWGLLQAMFIAVSAVIAVRASAVRGARMRLAAVAVAFAGAGTVATILFGQWDGLPALGLAVAYALWRRGAEIPAAAVLCVAMLSGKPQLALALGAFVIGRSLWRGAAGLTIGGVVTALVSLALVGSGGIAGWLHTLGITATVDPSGSISVFGLAADVMGNGPAAQVLATLAAVGLIAMAWMLGHASRQPAGLEVCLLGATCASLLASPHLFVQDLALLTPVFAAVLMRIHDRRTVAVIAWLALVLAAEYQILPFGSERPDALVPLLLLAAMGFALVTGAGASARGRLGVPAGVAQR